MLLRLENLRTRSSGDVIVGRPISYRARSGSIAAPTEVPLGNSIIDAPTSTFVTAPWSTEKPVRAECSRPSHGSCESSGFLSPKEKGHLRPTLAEQQRVNDSATVIARAVLLLDERQHLGYFLFVLAGSGELRAAKVVRMVSWLSTASPDEPVLAHVLTATLTTVDATTSLASDLALVGLMKSEFAKPNWRMPEIQAVLTIKWC
ncbi:hypothetical protein FRC12_004783 [Ceratobasidium sp. 428]|nr:hypothetical protein FRC09_000917 [Ceratobasidium sp. 395]KAG8769729.1 hypothetical protein FRC12_004783 [Ceratobasidium sp. 428]